MKISLKLDAPSSMTPTPSSSGTSMSSKNQGREMKCSWCWILMKLSRKLQQNQTLGPSGISISSETPGRNMEGKIIIKNNIENELTKMNMHWQLLLIFKHQTNKFMHITHKNILKSFKHKLCKAQLRNYGHRSPWISNQK